MLTQFNKEELMQISQKMNPFGRSVAPSGKSVLFSFNNYKQKYLKTLQSISLAMFLKQSIAELDNWIDDVPVEDKEQFRKHLELFRQHFLEFNPDIHCRSSCHKEEGA